LKKGRDIIQDNAVVIIFKEEGEPFNVAGLNDLGQIPHVLLIVQPYQTKYRVSCIKKNEVIESIEPQIPSKVLINGTMIQDFLLVKAHNAIMGTRFIIESQKKLYEYPRLETIKEIAKNYLKKKKKKEETPHSKNLKKN